MLLQSLIAENAIGVARLLGAALICWSWGNAFRMIGGSERKENLNQGMLITGFGRF